MGGAAMNPLLIRRRGMMQAQQVTPIERLRQLGCIFWFPLDLDNGLNDVVGGYAISETYNDAFVYNANYGHLAKVRQHQQVVANININISDYHFIDDNYTTITQYRRYSTQANTAANAVIFHTQSENILIGINASGTSVTSNWDTNIQTTVLAARRDGRTIYNNGNVIINDSYVYPSIANDGAISVYDAYNYTSDRYVYCRNMMLLRKALTVEEIAEVMQIAGITW